ncbi:hypothetical protein CF319_g9519, partial [Tilletia indica]
ADVSLFSSRQPAFNLLGYDENIILIEEEMHHWDDKGMFGDSRHFSRIGSFFGRESFLPMEEFLLVTDSSLTEDEQYERARAFRAARRVRTEKQEGADEKGIQYVDNEAVGEQTFTEMDGPRGTLNMFKGEELQKRK